MQTGVNLTLRIQYEYLVTHKERPIYENDINFSIPWYILV